MSYQTEQIPSSSANEIFDIPAAHEEVTLEQSENKQHEIGQSPMKRPKVIMLQRSSGIPGQPPKAIKIVTVPGQGNGGKPIRAAVIPMHLLNRGLRIPGATNLGQRIVSPSPSRVLTLKSNQNTPQFGYNSFNNSSRMDDSSDASMLDLGGHQHMHSGGQLIELGGNPPLSPQGKDDYNDLELNMNTPLKTNGLRRYARCVCNKVKEKGVTSYSEVADELVHEYAAEHPMIPSEQLHYIQKNIRRRVYDALNVLMALNVLQKEKKEIHWVGLPVNMIEECRRLEEEREKRQIALRNKTNDIQDLILQLIAFKNLIVRNKLNEKYKKSAKGNNAAKDKKVKAGSKKIDEYLNNDCIPLPFLIVSTNKRTLVDANISEDKLQYTFTFDQPFEIRDDIDILKRMGLTLRLGTPQCQQEEFNQCLELVPPSMRFYVEAINARRQAIVPNFEALHQQRRLFVEARMAAATGPNEIGENETGATGSGDAVKQIHFQHRGLTSGDGNSDYIPGDTQHYVRSAASRAFQGKTGQSITGATIGRNSRHPPNVTSILSNSQSSMMNSSMDQENLMMDAEDGDMKLNESLEEDISGADSSREGNNLARHKIGKQSSPIKRPGYQVRLTATPHDMGHGNIENMHDEEDDIEDMEDVDEDY